MSKLVAFSFLTLVLTLLLAACGAPAPDGAAGRRAPDGALERDGPLRVVTTTGMIGDMASRIAGEHAEVVSLMGPGIDPHLYKASESDVRRLASADLILYNGLHLEGKMGDILVKMARSRPVVAVTEAVPAEALREPPELQGQYDPHIWFDVRLWASTLAPITDELVELDPEHADIYRANAEAVRAELLEVDAWVATRVAEIPRERRILITAHDAFGYFGDRYDIEVMGIQGISTVAEAGLKDVDRVVDTIVERGVKAIFVESSVPRRAVEAVQAAVRDRGNEVVIGGQLYSDAMGAAGTPEGTYVGMVRANVETLVEALR